MSVIIFKFLTKDNFLYQIWVKPHLISKNCAASTDLNLNFFSKWTLVKEIFFKNLFYARKLRLQIHMLFILIKSSYIFKYPHSHLSTFLLLHIFKLKILATPFETLQLHYLVYLVWLRSCPVMFFLIWKTWKYLSWPHAHVWNWIGSVTERMWCKRVIAI